MTCKNEFIYTVVPSVSLVSSILSIIGSVLTIIGYLFYNKRNRNKNKTIFHLIFLETSFLALIFWLAVADLLTSITIAIQQVFLLGVPMEYNFNVCRAFRGIVQYFVLTTFSWSSCIAIDLYLTVRTVNPVQRKKKKRYFRLFHLFSWGVPFVIIAILEGTNKVVKNDGGWCHAIELYQWLFWFLPILLSIVVNIAMYLSIYRRFQSMLGELTTISATAKLEHSMERKLTLYLLAFIFCWIWDLAYHLANVATDNWCVLSWLWILPNTFAPLQGFLNFLVYGVTNKLTPSMPLSSFSDNSLKDAMVEDDSREKLIFNGLSSNSNLNYKYGSM